MGITLKSALTAAGITDAEHIHVLRYGFPSLVVRVHTSAFDGKGSVILKACPPSSPEPDILIGLHRIGLPVPMVFDVRESEGFRVIVMEDVGADALCKHPDAEWYKAAVRAIARIHRQSRLSLYCASCPPDGSHAALTDLAPTYDDAKWEAIVREGLEGTLRRVDDGTYWVFEAHGTNVGGRERDRDGLARQLSGLAEKTLDMIRYPSTGRAFPNVLVHGDYHDGNILIRAAETGAAAALTPSGPFAIVDWDSARWDSGFFDLVSLFDVSERMGTFHLGPEEIIKSYLDAYAGPHTVTHGCDLERAKAEWRRCRVLRAWNELRWFAETGEDFGDRIGRETKIIREQAI